MNDDEKSFRGFVSTKEAASYLGYTVQHTRLLIRQGELEATKFGRDWMIVRESIAEYKSKKQEANGNAEND